MTLTPQPEKYAQIVGGDKVEKDDSIGERGLLNQIDRMIGYLQEEGKMSEGDAKKVIVAGIVTEGAKKEGDPNEVYNSYPSSAKDKLLYSPEDLERNQDVTVLGTKLSVAAFLGATALSVAGVVIASVFKSKLPKWMRIVPAIALPFILSALLSRLGWTISSAVNNWNDVFHWGPQFAQQQKTAMEKKTSSGTGGGVDNNSEPRTIIRMVTESKPVQFLGTLYSAKLGNVDAFERKLDDEITDTEDLLNDVSLNLNRWLKSLPGRMGYSITIRKDPVDEFGVKQSGIWACLTLIITHISGTTTPIDTIILGPVNPAMRLEIVKSTKTIEAQIPKLISTGEIKEIQLPNGIVDIFSTEGEKVFSTEKTTTPTNTNSTTTQNNTTKAWYIIVQEKSGNYQVGPFTNESAANNAFLDIDAQFRNKKVGYNEMKIVDINPNLNTWIGVGENKTSTTSSTQSSSATSTTLRVGNSGEQVKELQRFLNTQGESLIVDGSFGSLTEQAVKRFQSKNGLTADGIVGPITQEVIAKKKRANEVAALEAPQSEQGAIMDLLNIGSKDIKA